MKKIIGLIVAALTLAVISSNVFAAEMPVKKICLEAQVLMLSENGNLLLTDTLDSSTKKLLCENVLDFKLESNMVNDNYSAYTNDGKVYHISFNFEKKYDIKEFSADVKTPINLASEYGLLYIDLGNNLIKQNCIDNEKTTILKDVNKATWSQYNCNYAIVNNNTLYRYDTDTYETEFIMSDVCDIRNIGYLTDVALKQNGDLYLINEKGINKIASDIGSIDNDKLHNTNIFSMIDQNDDLYISWELKYDSENVSLQKIGDNFSKILYYNYDSHAIDNSGILYKISQFNSEKISIEDEKFNCDKKINDVIAAGYKYFYLTDKGVFINKQENAVSIEVDIKNIVYGYPDNYICLLDNGDVWAFDDSITSLYRTSLSDKSTVLKVNGKISELKNNLQIVDNRTMYPFRECLDIIGASVQWDGEKQIAIGEVPGIKIEFPIGKNDYYINGVKHTMDATTYVDNTIGRTYIPIRYAAEGLGYTVDWIEGDFENTISIHK